uniref:Uncharacterized protein n=1 Tax=Anguilla anguilla TaxID=7936 RepID=A0A0E9PD47_ANGAN
MKPSLSSERVCRGVYFFYLFIFVSRLIPACFMTYAVTPRSCTTVSRTAEPES